MTAATHAHGLPPLTAKPGIWLAVEYRLLPVKFRQIERNGEVAGELVIKEILVSDQ